MDRCDNEASPFSYPFFNSFAFMELAPCEQLQKIKACKDMLTPALCIRFNHVAVPEVILHPNRLRL